VGEKRKAEDEGAGPVAPPQPSPAVATTAAAAPTGDARAELFRQVLRQVEFYFSDSNLPRDKFLRAKTEENEGCMSAEGGAGCVPGLTGLPH
jgi:hypothetical protein